MNQTLRPKFKLGELVGSPETHQKISPDDIVTALRRHHVGDWGEVGPQTVATNEQSLKNGLPVLISAYKSSQGVRFFLVTETNLGTGGVTNVILEEEDPNRLRQYLL